MEDQSAYELAIALQKLSSQIDVQNARQEEANELLRSLISTLQETAQELLDLKEQLKKSDGNRVSLPLIEKS